MLFLQQYKEEFISFESILVSLDEETKKDFLFNMITQTEENFKSILELNHNSIEFKEMLKNMYLENDLPEEFKLHSFEHLQELVLFVKELDKRLSLKEYTFFKLLFNSFKFNRDFLLKFQPYANCQRHISILDKILKALH